MFLLSKLAWYESGFSVNLVITTIWANNHLLPSFLGKQSPLLYSLPMFHYPLKVSGKSIIVKLTGKSFKFGIFLKFHGLQVYYSVFQWQISLPEIYLSLLLIICASKPFWILLYIPRVILKLHLDGKLQVTWVYYPYYKRNFSYCQTLWLIKC